MATILTIRIIDLSPVERVDQFRAELRDVLERLALHIGRPGELTDVLRDRNGRVVGTAAWGPGAHPDVLSD